MNYDAFYKVTYGLYVVSASYHGRKNGYIANTVFQVTATPEQFAISCNKNNLTCGLIEKSKSFAFTVLSRDADPGLIQAMGFKSGHQADKMTGLALSTGTTGAPIVLNDAVAWFECKVEKSFDAGTHILFIGRVINCGMVDDTREPLTYDYYRKTYKSTSPANAPTYIDKSRLSGKSEPGSTGGKKFLCSICGYVYDPDEGDEKTGIPAGTAFESIPEGWECPVCNAKKSSFVEY